MHVKKPSVRNFQGPPRAVQATASRTRGGLFRLALPLAHESRIRSGFFRWPPPGIPLAVCRLSDHHGQPGAEVAEDGPAEGPGVFRISALSPDLSQAGCQLCSVLGCSPVLHAISPGQPSLTRHSPAASAAVRPSSCQSRHGRSGRSSRLRPQRLANSRSTCRSQFWKRSPVVTAHPPCCTKACRHRLRVGFLLVPNARWGHGRSGFLQLSGKYAFATLQVFVSDSKHDMRLT